MALLGNTLATGAMLVVLILMFGEISGAHFNPAVTLSFALRREIGPSITLSYVLVQDSGFPSQRQPSAWSPPSSAPCALAPKRCPMQ